MTTTLISEPDFSLLPAVCTCISNPKHKVKVTEFSDFTHIVSSGNDGPIDFVYVICPACNSHAAPPNEKMKDLINSYELWKHSDPHKEEKIWSKRFRCPQCKQSSTIVIRNVKVFNTAVGYAGETWDPEVRIICPICKSYTNADGKIPQGIYDSVLNEAESKRNR